MDNNTGNRNHDETLYSVGEICRITGITRKTLFTMTGLDFLCLMSERNRSSSSSTIAKGSSA